ncbi:unnamed protein product [Prorocentrum cordatum]|uniref:Uncharacterized protein n=1 Tax=Prorocentrum cordatum TaxID=2364126 RepID=A0ABN9R2A4_9DINO|nr:unnamed protein product [Polarella glacialis]
MEVLGRLLALVACVLQFLMLFDLRGKFSGKTADHLKQKSRQGCDPVRDLCDALSKVLAGYTDGTGGQKGRGKGAPTRRQDAKAQRMGDLIRAIEKTLSNAKTGSWSIEQLIKDLMGTIRNFQAAARGGRDGGRKEADKTSNHPRLSKLVWKKGTVFTYAAYCQVNAVRDLALAQQWTAKVGILVQVGGKPGEKPQDCPTAVMKWLRVEGRGQGETVEGCWIAPLDDAQGLPLSLGGAKMTRAQGAVANKNNATEELVTLRVTMVQRFASEPAWKTSMLSAFHSLWNTAGVTRTYGFRILESADDKARTCFATVQKSKAAAIRAQSGKAGTFAEQLVCQHGRAVVEWQMQEDGEGPVAYLERVLRQGRSSSGTDPGLAFRRGGKSQLGWRQPPGAAAAPPDKPLPWEVHGTPATWSEADVASFLEDNRWTQATMLRPRSGRRGWAFKMVPPAGAHLQNTYELHDSTVVKIRREVRRQAGMEARPISAKPGFVRSDQVEAGKKREEKAAKAAAGTEPGAEKAKGGVPDKSLGYKSWDLGGCGGCFYRAVGAAKALLEGKTQEAIEKNAEGIGAKLRAEATALIRAHGLWQDSWVKDDNATPQKEGGPVPDTWDSRVTANARKGMQAMKAAPLPVCLKDEHYFALVLDVAKAEWPMEWGEEPEEEVSKQLCRGAGDGTDDGDQGSNLDGRFQSDRQSVTTAARGRAVQQPQANNRNTRQRNYEAQWARHGGRLSRAGWGRQRVTTEPWACPMKDCGYVCAGVAKKTLATRRSQKKEHRLKCRPGADPLLFDARQASDPVAVPRSEEEVRQQLALPADAPVPAELMNRQRRKCGKWWPSLSAAAHAKAVAAHNKAEHAEDRQQAGEARKKALQEQKEENREAAAEGRQPRQLHLVRRHARDKDDAARKAEKNQYQRERWQWEKGEALAAGLPWPPPGHRERAAKSRAKLKAESSAAADARPAQARRKRQKAS